MYGEGIISILS